MSSSKSKKKWFVYTPGVGAFGGFAYSPRTWQGWLIAIGYFVSLLTIPAIISFMPFDQYSANVFITELVLLVLTFTVTYLYIGKKNS